MLLYAYLFHGAVPPRHLVEHLVDVSKRPCSQHIELVIAIAAAKVGGNHRSIDRSRRVCRVERGKEMRVKEEDGVT